MLIDTQLHLVDPVRFPIPAAAGGYVPRGGESGDLDALLAVLDAHGVAGGVLVQPSGYGTDNAALFDALGRGGSRLRAVAMATADSIERIAAQGARGLRLNLTDYADHAMPAALGLGTAALDCGMILQVQAPVGELSALLEGLPDGPVVIDHLGRPDPAHADQIDTVAALAARGRTYLKVSGGFRLGPEGWPQPSDGLRELVGNWPRDRVVWGSDWPFLNVAGSRPTYSECLAWAGALTDLRAASQTAARLFGFGHVV